MLDKIMLVKKISHFFKIPVATEIPKLGETLVIFKPRKNEYYLMDRTNPIVFTKNIIGNFWKIETSDKSFLVLVVVMS